MKALVLGKDGRTDCIAEALVAGGATVFSMSDYKNPGLKRKSKVFRHGRTDDLAGVIAFARETTPDFAVIGPEEPLAAGVVDALMSIGVPSVGPSKSLARLESSKAFTRRLMRKYLIPGNVEHRAFSSPDGLEAYCRDLGDFVVKPDGLTGGKGVKILGEQLNSIDEAVAYARSLLPNGGVVIEERLEGEEFSLQSFCDGNTVVDSIPVQDHKRALEDDLGQNTGGMGSYSCEDHRLPFLSEGDIREASAINLAVNRAIMEETGEPFKGILYGGFMLTSSGVRLLEYNVRLGDPEAMNVLLLLETNFVEICEGIITGRLSRVPVTFKDKAVVCNYIVPKGYPENPVRNVPVDLDCIPDRTDELRIYFAAVHEERNTIILTGSRAVAFAAIADSVPEAGKIVEEAIRRVGGPVEHRKDIGTLKLLQKRMDHMKHLYERRA